MKWRRKKNFANPAWRKLFDLPPLSPFKDTLGPGLAGLGVINRLAFRAAGDTIVPMQMEKTTEGEATVLKLAGEIDLHASPPLRQELKTFAAAKTAVLLVDFTEVEYIDSSGLATFIEYLREAQRFSGRLALFGLKKKVRTIFDLVRLNELFPILETREQALEAVLDSKSPDMAQPGKSSPTKAGG